MTVTEVRETTMRRRVLDAALDMIATVGWSEVTMGRLADHVGVSRQTVYNEVGAKPALAEALVNEELAQFMAVVDGAFDDHPTDPIAAMRGAVLGVLRHAEDNPLLHAVVSATHGADTELLPLLTTHAGPLLGVAHGVVANRVRAYDLDLTDRQVDVVVDVIVRTVLSHVMQSSGDPELTADGFAWLAERVLRA